jgi:hypothetical protein
MKYQGSCHCGRIAFTLDAEVGEAIDCNCSMCRRRGALLAAFPRSALTLTTAESDLHTYQFNKHLIHHHFCAHCGVSPFSEGSNRNGDKTVMVNLRCLPEVDLAALKVTPFDGASY